MFSGLQNILQGKPKNGVVILCWMLFHHLVLIVAVCIAETDDSTGKVYGHSTD